METMSKALPDRLVEVILADQDLVDAEFDTLIVAVGLDPPPSLGVDRAVIADGDKHPRRKRQPTRRYSFPGDYRPVRPRSPERAPPTPALPLPGQVMEVKPLANPS